MARRTRVTVPGHELVPMSARPKLDRRTRRARRAAARRRAAPGGSYLSAALRFVGAALAAGALVGSAAAAGAAPGAVAVDAVSTYVRNLPDTLPNIVVPARSRIVAADGTEVAQVFTINRVPVPGDQMSPWLRSAAVAVEDYRFYTHPGVDLAGVARAVVSTGSGSQVQGGSTITQQYVKNMLIADAVVAGGGEADPEAVDAAAGRSLDRKAREMKTAMAIERRMSKDDILTGYLNISYFGAGAYGAEAAAQRYFSKPAAALNLPEAAMLAGLLQSPSRYDPLAHPQAATARRDDVLSRMLATGAATPAQVQAARATPVTVHPSAAPNGCVAAAPDFGFVCAAVLDELDSATWVPGGKAGIVSAGGYTITTTVDPALQHAATAAARADIGNDTHVADAAVSVVPGTGAIAAMATNREYGSGPGATEIVLPTAAAFSAGSTFKLFTLLAAIEAGINVDTVMPAGPAYVSSVFDNPPGGFHNAEGGGDANVTIRRATELSMNTAYVQLLEKVGIGAADAMVRRLGVSSIGDVGAADGPGVKEGTFTLGVRPVSVVDMAGAYAAVAADGMWCQPHLIASVAAAGRPPTVNPAPSQCRRVLAPAVAQTATNVLAGDATRGTGTAGALDDGRPVATKTGTAENYSAAWYIGYTPQLATAVWMGDPDRPLDGLYDVAGVPVVYGGTLPARVFKATMTAGLAGKPVIALPNVNPDYLLGLGGPPSTLVAVPDVVGQAGPGAAAALTGQGWKVTLSAGAPVPGVVPGTVVGQNPPAGTVQADKSVPVTLTTAG